MKCKSLPCSTLVIAVNIFTVICFCFLLPLFSSCTKEADPDPVADFSYTTSGSIVPCTVSFENKSKNADSFHWDFGNGTTTTSASPGVQYNATGTYTITLTASRHGKSSTKTAQITVQPAPQPEVTVTASPQYVYLPNNCASSFVITNSGPAGTILSYSVLNSNTNTEHLVFTNPSGALPSGGSVTVSVSVDPADINAPFIIGSTLNVEVNTPNALNRTQTFLPVYIRSMADQAQNLAGTWSGTWSGNSYGAANPGQPSPSTPVSGTWTINVQSVNPAGNTASGTVTWNGNDAYWTYTLDGNGNITSATSHPFNANSSFPFSSSNASFITPSPGSACDRFRLVINDFPGSSYGVYGPRMVLDMNLRSNTVVSGASSWTAWPYTPVYVNNLSVSQSNGSLSGAKQ